MLELILLGNYLNYSNFSGLLASLLARMLLLASLLLLASTKEEIIVLALNDWSFLGVSFIASALPLAPGTKYPSFL